LLHLGVIVGAVAVVGRPASAQGVDRRWTIDPETAPRPVARAALRAGAIEIDGVLDDRAWEGAVPIADFVQSQPNPGYPATEATVVRIIYDDDKLYIGAICYDSDIDRRTVTTLEYGLPPSTRDMDVFAITLDPFLDRRNSFIWLVNPYGAYRDGQTFNDSRQSDYAWRGVVEIVTTVHDSGWTVEMAIPWTTVRFDPSRDGQQWGMTLLRRVRRKNEDSYWAPVDRRDPVHRMSKAGTLTGLQGMHPGHGLTVKPFMLGTDVSGRRGAAADDEGLDAGGDLKYGITPSLVLDATYRTDFSQVEVDQERINLTRFPLFFQEKRDFFVENSGSFVLGDVAERNYRMGSSTRSFTLFHSRRIGLAGGLPIPIVGGARLSGRAGPLEIGVLDIQTEAVDSAPGENFAVVRIRRNLGGSDVGLTFLNRQATGAFANGEFNRTYAADANLRFLGNMIVNTYFARTDGPGAGGNENAARIQVGWRDRVWDASAFVKHVGDAFNPELGFVRRRGIRHGYATFGAHPRPRVPHVQEINPYGEIHYVTDLQNVLETRNAVLGLGVQFLDGSTLSMRYQNGFERLDTPFSVSGIAIPLGDYETSQGSVTYTSSRARPLSARASLSGGGFWNGSRYTVSGSAVWRASYRWAFDASWSHNGISLPDGSFSTDVMGGRIRFGYNTDLFTSAFVQYNSSTDQLVTNVRVNFIHAPLSDFFLVYSERRDLRVAAVLDRVVTAKVTKLFAF
jgi:hypothetical protein